MAEQPLQILVVEDDELDRMIMERALKGSGMKYELRFAEDHESGKIAATEKEYDCIFLDYNLPGGTGLELLKEIRAARNTSPIILVTSQGDEKIAVDAMKNGANDYIPKSLLSADGIAQSVRFMVTLKNQEHQRLILEQQLRETERRLKTVVANSPIILFSLDEHARFTLIEGNSLQTMGINKQDYLGKTIREFHSIPIQEEDFRKAMAGEETTSVVEINSKYFEIFYTPIYSEKKVATGVIGVASDITGHKRAEDELKKAMTLAEETARLKEQFLANMSHEIRTPMNGIIGLTRILLNTELSEEQLRFLQSIKVCSDNLLVIINDILDLSKIEAGKMSFESVPFRMEDLARHAVELFQSKADEKAIQLSAKIDSAIPEGLCGDPTRLSQILNNLMSNAIKFTNEGEVSLMINLRSNRENQVTIDFEIKDSGIGIPEQSLDSIFESFTQASTDTTRKFGGTGLGLTIVKRLIELQGGNIGVRSKPGSGTTFFFHLSFEISNEKHLTATTVEEKDNRTTSHLRILVAEDNPINQLIVKKLFSDWETPVEFAENGKIAIEKLTHANFDLVLMDIQMPEMDGYTAAHHIRTVLPEPIRSIPIMAMTAHATQNEKQKCYDAGMDNYISKPFEPAELKKKILELTISPGSPLNGSESHSIELKPRQEMDQTQDNSQISSRDEHRNSLQTPNLVIENPSSRTEPIIPEHQINLTYLKQIAEGNDSFIIEMLEMFLNKTPEALENLDASFRQSNWEELKQIAHRIKPSFGYIGLSGTQKLLAEIERLSEDHINPERIGELVGEVRQVSKSVFVQLQTALTGMK
ncbi:MAG TPA: response regulator [Bacteroidia bacterium]|nr:response regulator [Bacteroidia bacterium]